MINNIYTIGFSKKDAETFFKKLTENNIKKLIDIRLNNKSQLAGFANAKHLPYFLKLHKIEYFYHPEFAPSKELLDGYKKKEITWNEYEKTYPNIIKSRDVLNKISIEELKDAVLLCSEPTSEKCHRRLIAEMFKNLFDDLQIIHL